MENKLNNQALKQAPHKVRGVSLLSAVFDEISDCIEDCDFSTEELLQSAQKLIDLAKKDFVTDTHSEPGRHDGYYSHDVCTAFEKYQGRILKNDYNYDHDQSLEIESLYKVQQLMGGSRNNMNWSQNYA